MANATVVAQLWKNQSFPSQPVKIGSEKRAAAPGALEDVVFGGADDLWGIDPAELTTNFINTLLMPSVTMDADQGVGASCELDSMGVTVHFEYPDGRRGSISMPIGINL